MRAYIILTAGIAGPTVVHKYWLLTGYLQLRWPTLPWPLPTHSRTALDGWLHHDDDICPTDSSTLTVDSTTFSGTELCNASIVIVDVHCVISLASMHISFEVALRTIPLLLDTLWEAYRRISTEDLDSLQLDHRQHSGCAPVSAAAWLRESMSPLVCANISISLHIANLRQLTLRGPDLRTGPVHKLQLKQRLTSQLHHFAELSYNSSPTAWLASTNSPTQLNVQPNFAITQPKLRLTWTQLHNT